MKRILIIVCCLCCSISFAANKKTNLKEPQKTYPPKTKLTFKAMRLQAGMTRKQVYLLLGKPTWAQTIKGIPLDWTWKNGKCNPVDVTFDQYLKVNGFDEGRAECLTREYENVPNNIHLCSNSKNHLLCDPKSKLKIKHYMVDLKHAMKSSESVFDTKANIKKNK